MNTLRVIQWIVGVAAITSILFFVYSNHSPSASINTFLLFLAVAALSPVAVWWWLVSLARTLAARYALITAGVVVFTAGGLIYYDAFFVHIDALSALALVFIPPWQIGAIGLVFAVSYFVQNRRRARDMD